jgi:hypothetical protein
MEIKENNDNILLFDHGKIYFTKKTERNFYLFLIVATFLFIIGAGVMDWIK